MHTVDDSNLPGTERLVYSVVRIAGALVALHTRSLTFSKRGCVYAYAKLIGDEWSGFVAEVLSICHDQWQNRIPSDAMSRRQLRGFYEHVLPFENHFLGVYKALLISDLNSADEQFRKAAQERLATIFQYQC